MVLTNFDCHLCLEHISIVQVSTNKTQIIYQPCFRNSFTRTTVARKLSKNLLLHLSLRSLFRFNPGLSWNLCLCMSPLTLFLLQIISNLRKLLPTSTPAPMLTVRPCFGFRRNSIFGAAGAVRGPTPLIRLAVSNLGAGSFILSTLNWLDRTPKPIFTDRSRSLAELPLFIKSSSDRLDVLAPSCAVREVNLLVRLPPIPALSQLSELAMSSGVASVGLATLSASSASSGLDDDVGADGRAAEYALQAENVRFDDLELIELKACRHCGCHREIDGVRKAGKGELWDRSKASAALRSSIVTVNALETRISQPLSIWVDTEEIVVGTFNFECR